MKFKYKNYKLLKIKSFLKSNKNFLAIYNGINCKNSDWIKIEQKFKKNNLKCYKLKNTLIKNILKTSIFENLNFVLNGSTFFIKIPLKKNINNLRNLTENFFLLSFIFKNKLYSNIQIEKIKNFNFNDLFKFINYFISNIVKILISKLLIISTGKNRNNVI